MYKPHHLISASCRRRLLKSRSSIAWPFAKTAFACLIYTLFLWPYSNPIADESLSGSSNKSLSGFANKSAKQGPENQRQAELIHLLKQDCGSCHGLYLTGGLGPALTPKGLSTKDVDQLTQIILHGRPQLAMPPWQGILTETEARWLAEQLVTGL